MVDKKLNDVGNETTPLRPDPEQLKRQEEARIEVEQPTKDEGVVKSVVNGGTGFRGSNLAPSQVSPDQLNEAFGLGLAHPNSGATRYVASREDGTPLKPGEEGVPEPPRGEAALPSLAELGLEPNVDAGTPTGNSPAPGAFYTAPGSYMIGPRDIFASSIGQRITSYTLRAASVTADANGDKIVREGTVLSLHVASGKMEPRTSGTAAGILVQRVNLRNGDAPIAMCVAGAVREDKLTDNGTFGTVASGVRTDLPHVQFMQYDI